MDETAWIRTKDYFPEDLDEVLLYHPFKKVDGSDSFIIFSGWYDEENAVWVCGWSTFCPAYHAEKLIDDDFCLCSDEVTHWMPLPKKPKNLLNTISKVTDKNEP